MAKKPAARSKKVKLTDLAVKRGKGGQANKIKGGVDCKIETLGKVSSTSLGTFDKFLR